MKILAESLCCYHGSVKKIFGFVEKIQVVNSSVHQTNKPVFCWLFLGTRKPNLLYWLNPQVIFSKRNRPKNLISKKKCIQGLGTSIANVDSPDLSNHQLQWGCSVFFRNQLLIFGVHESAPNWSSVSYEAEKPFYNKISDFKTNEQLQTRVPPRKTRKIVPSNTL